MAEGKTASKKKNTKKESTEAKTKIRHTTSQKCGIIMPISKMDDYTEGHWANVKEIIFEALADTGFECDLVSNARETRIIHAIIVQNIYENEMVIVDISGRNPNVMFELGLRLAFDKPAIVIKDELTPYSFDTSPIEHINYPSNLSYPEIVSFKEKLRSKVLDTFAKSKEKDFSPFVGHFGNFKVVGLKTEEVSRDDFLVKSMKQVQLQIRELNSQIERKNRSDEGLVDEGYAPRRIVYNMPGVSSARLKDICNDLRGMPELKGIIQTAYGPNKFSVWVSRRSWSVVDDKINDYLSDLGHTPQSIAVD